MRSTIASPLAADLDHLVLRLIDRDAGGDYRADADVVGATTTLVAMLRRAADAGSAADVLTALARALGDRMFPALVKLLMTVGESRDPPARQALAAALGAALARGDVPSGTLSSWGAAAVWLPTPGAAFFGGGVRRHLDPVAFVTAWHSQPTDRPALRDAVFARATTALLSIFDAHPSAAALYQAKLRSDIDHLPAGTFTDLTRLRLAAIADGWAAGHTPATIAARAAACGSERPPALPLRLLRPLV